MTDDEKKYILIVSRDKELVTQVKDLLADLPLIVRTATDGNYLDSFAKMPPPYIILVDTNIGHDKAVKICMQLQERANKHDMAILVLISEMDDRTLTALLDAGAEDVMGRRLRPLSFRTRVTAHLNRIGTRRRLRLKVRDSELLIDITSKMVSTDDLLANLYEIATLIADELDANRCSVVLVRPQKDFGLVIASSDDKTLRSQPINLKHYPEIIRSGEEATPIIISDISTEPLLANERHLIKEAGFNSMALFPIVRKKETLGIIFLRFKKNRYHFEKREIVFCQTVANAASIALRNAEIIESLKAKTREVEKVQTEVKDQLRNLKRYQDFFLSAIDGNIVLEQSGRMVFVNPKAAALLKTEPIILEGQLFENLLEQEDRGEFLKLLDEFIRGEARRSVDLKINRNDREECVVSVSAGALFGEEGLMLLTLRDVTEERAIERLLDEARHRIVLSEKRVAMAELAGAAAHELNQPLTVLMTTLAMLRRLLEKDTKTEKILNTMEQESERMASIIRRMTEITNYTTKEYVGEAKIIDLEQAVGNDLDEDAR